MKTPFSWPSAGLVLVMPGGVEAGEAQRQAADLAAQLAADLSLALQPLLADPGLDPNQQLAALTALPSGWLLPLGLDPGADLLVAGRPVGCWAEALAAWRQPTLLVLPAALAGQGGHRAYHALLQQAGVPLLGLVQLGGPWCAAARREDRLPWLGWWPGDPYDTSLLIALQSRWRQLSSAMADPAQA